MPAPELRTLGRYTIRRVLGRGAMGVVYEGLDPKLDRAVAIKTILKAHLDDSAARDYSARFVREAHAVARLNHPHIVQVYDFGEEGDIAYLVMEFIRGRELQGYFNAGERFEPKEAVRIMSELSSALEFAHQSGIIHRDVKPANVMLDSQGHTKLTDFGVARVQDTTRSHATQAGTLVGTPAYMSPEQITGTAIDRRTDVFAAGIILYQFLTGELPFSGGPWTIAKKIMQDQPALPSSINTTVSPLFDAVVGKALVKEPDGRYQSMRAFSVALKRALEGKAEEDDADRTVVQPAARAAPSGAQATGSQPATHPGSYPGMQDADVEFWRSIKDSNDAEDFESYLRKFPNGIYADLAQRKLGKLRDAGEQVRREAKAKLEAEARAREIEENANREAAEEAKRQAAERAKLEAEQRKRAAEEKAKRDAEALARRQQEQARKAQAAVASAEQTIIAPRPGAAPPGDRAGASSRPIVIGAAVAIGLAVAAAAAWYATRAPAPQAPQAKPEPRIEQPSPAQQQAAEKATADKAAADKAAADKLAADRAAAEKLMAEARAAAEKAAAERAAAQKAVADLAAAERAAADRAAAARLATERAAAERVAAERVAAERKATAERAAAEKLAAERAAAEKLAADKAAAERSAADRAAAEKAAAERAAAEKAKAEQARLAAAAAASPFPQAGDSWTYRLTEPKPAGKPGPRNYTVRVALASEQAIVERFSLEGGPSGEWTHGRGRYLASLGRSLFSPYLSVFEELSPPARLGAIEIKDEKCKTQYLCEAEGRVVGRESIGVTAGNFETIKIVVDHKWRPAVVRSQSAPAGWFGTRRLTVWYAPAVKRAVKFSSRGTVDIVLGTRAGDNSAPPDTDFDLELVSYQLR